MTAVNQTQAERGARFRALHEGEPFVIPNPWDAGSAMVLEALGFPALATTSSGFAFTLGRPDGGVTLDEVLAHTSALADATNLPVSVDLEDGHGPAPEDAARAITAAGEAGAVGGSIEDWDRDRRSIFDADLATERIAAAAEASRRLPFPFTLTGRAENHVHGIEDLDDTIARLQAYAQAGADVLFAPGLRTPDQIRTVRAGVSKPLNVLALGNLSRDELVGAGAQRISVGGSLTWTAVEAMAAAAGQIRDAGDFSSLARPTRVRDWLAD
jgi:2-methylisocitrate lyase-like PEP mutase family enzyme